MLTTPPTKLRSALLFGLLRLLIICVAMLAPTSLFLNVSSASEQQTLGREIAFPKLIKWNRQRGVTRYRLQIAGDEYFHDVLFDLPVSGEQYLVSNLSPGYYYWRIAPVASRTDFSPPLRFFVSGGVVTAVWIPSRSTAHSTGLVSPRVP